MKDKLNKIREYCDYVERHYDNVQKAWKLINDKCPNSFRFIHDDYIWHSIDQNVKSHDLSKVSPEEFIQYQQYFFPSDIDTKNKDLFLIAWENHKKENPHHWQNWTVQYKEHPYNIIFFVENIVDWIAMGFEFGDTAKEYYEKNKKDIHIPKWAEDEMYKIFECIY